MNKLRSWFLKSVPEEHYNEFRIEILKENISRIQIYSLLFLFIEIFYIISDIMNYYKGLWIIESSYKNQFYLHLLIITLLLTYILILFTRKKKDNPAPFYNLFEIIFIPFVLTWASVSTLIQFPVSFSITPYIIGCLAISIAVYINAVFSFILYLSSFIFLIIGLYYKCSDLEKLNELITDSTIVILVSFIISKIIFQNKINFFLYQKKIEKEINEKDIAEQSLQKINSNLENLIKERTQTLITINEQLQHEINNKQILEKKLLTEKNTLNNIIENNPYSIAIFDKNGFFLRGNAAGLKMFSIEPPPDYCVFEDPQLPPEFHVEFEKLKKGETVYFPETIYNAHKNNPSFPDITVVLKTIMFPIKNVDGTIENFIQMHSDVTDRFNAENNLRQSEEKYRLIVENMEEGIYATQNGIFKSVNSAMIKMFGYSEAELLNTPAWNLAIPEIRENVKITLFNKVRQKDTTPIPVECIKKNGDIFYTDISVSGVSENGLVYGIVSDITHRKHAEEVLKESEAKYRLLVDNITEVLFLLDGKGNIIYLSEYFETITDYKIQNLIGKPLVDFVFIDDLPNLLESYSKTISGIENTVEFRLILNNGTLKFVKANSKLISKEDGTKQIIGVILDIESQKDVEKNLQILESAIDQSSDGIAIANMEGTLLYLNEAWAKMHDYEKSELIGKNLSISHNDFQIINDVNPHNALVIKHGFYKADVGHIKKDGTPFMTTMYTTLIKDFKGNPTGLIGIARILPDQKENEKSTNFREDKYKLLFDNSTSGILHINLNGDILDANQALLDMLGSKSIEKTKQLNVLTFSNLIESGISQKLQECIAKESVIISEHTYHSKWGKVIHARIKFKPIYDSENLITGVLATIDDITLQKESENALTERINTKFIHAENQKRIFLENISNAIRVPANTIQGFSNILKKPDLSDKKIRFVVTSIIDKSRVLLRNVNNIAIAAQLESKSLQLNLNKCSPQKIISELIKSYASIPENLNKKIDIREAANSDKNIILFTDEQRLTQVLAELLDNATKNTHYGIIEIGLRKEEDSILFYISDTGTGISPNRQKDFFKNLQTYSALSNSESPALGLIICKGIVENLGGRIWMKSEEGRGSTFYFTIPVNN